MGPIAAPIISGSLSIALAALTSHSGIRCRHRQSPLRASETGPIEVPVVGGLEFKALGKGEWRTIDNATYYVLLLNVTNGWNIRYEVYSEYLFLSDGIDDITVSKEQTSFDRQSLAPGQNTQFLAFFPIEEGDGALELTYSEPGKTPVSIPLGGT